MLNGAKSEVYEKITKKSGTYRTFFTNLQIQTQYVDKSIDRNTIICYYLNRCAI